jgi:hypothetical protein
MGKLMMRDLPERENSPKRIVVYVCPTKDCPDYYAASDFTPERADIAVMQYHRSQSDGSQVASHPRIECPLCRARGEHVNRVPYVVTEVVPYKELMSAVTTNLKRAAA